MTVSVGLPPRWLGNASKGHYKSVLKVPRRTRWTKCGYSDISLYERARDLKVMRGDVAPELAALGTCVFVTGMLRLWLMDEGGSLLRPDVDALITSHIAAFRTPPGKPVS